YAIPALGVIIGAFLVLRGFRVDKTFHNFIKWVRDYSPPPFTVQITSFSALAGILVIIVGGYLGGTAAANFAKNVNDAFGHIPRLIGEFLIASTYLIAIGMCVILSGRAVRWFFERDLRLWRTVVIVVGVAASSVMFVEASKLLIDPEAEYEPVILGVTYEPLLFAIVGGISAIVLTVLAVVFLRKKYRGYFKKTEKEMDDFEES
ncbi:MAG TPA: DUF373 family protein, partial [Candidatus Bathyarchaeota archaeon]|nr:DUF373 family protein [Candidatus Bathyarchaeota archaeon]